jgi:hypothetical protein
MTKFARLALLPFSIFFPGPSFAHDRLKLSFLSWLFTAFFLFVSAYSFVSYIVTAEANHLVGGPPVESIFTSSPIHMRDILYPVLLVIAGFPFTNSFIGISIVSAAFSFLMPLLVHASVGPSMRIAAFYASLALMLSLTPYIFIKFTFHDHLFMFLLIFTFFLSMKYLRSKQAITLQFATIASVLTGLARPAANLFPPCLLVTLFIMDAKPKNIWRYVIGIVVILAASAHLLASKSGVSESSYTGRQLLYNLYVNSRDFNVKIDASLGPATARLFEVLQNLPERPMESAAFSEWVRRNRVIGISEASIEKQFTSVSRDELIANIFNSPNPDYYEFLCYMEHDDRTYLRASLEVIAKYPSYPLLYTLRNAWLFMWTPGYFRGRNNVEYIGLHRSGNEFLPFHRSAGPTNGLAPRSLREIGHEPLETEFRFLKRFTSAIENYWLTYYAPINQIMMILVFLGAITSFFTGRDARVCFWLAAMFWGYHVGITASLAEGAYRYHFMVAPLFIICAALGLRSIAILAGRMVERVWRRQGVPAVIESANTQTSDNSLRGWIVYVERATNIVP